MNSNHSNQTAEVMRDLGALEALAEDWAELLERTDAPSTFLTPAWMLSWWQAYRPPASIATASIRRDGQLVGLAPMMLRVERRVGLPVTCLRFMGDGTIESDHLTFLADVCDSTEIHATLLDRVLALDWDVAELVDVPESSTLARLLPEWASSHGLLLEGTRVPCPMRSIPESFDALLASLPSRFRTAIRSTRRKLAADHHVKFGLHDDPAGFNAALQSLFENHESRWRAKGQSGVFVNPDRRRFYQLLTERLHAAGALRFFYLKLDGRIVAQEYCFAHGRTVYLLQEGFDFALARQNIGNALRSFVFEYLIEHRYAAYDFLAGMSRHKQNWSDATPNDVTFSIARPTLKGRIAYHAPRLIEAAKDRLRPLRDRLRNRIPSSSPAPAEAQPE